MKLAARNRAVVAPQRVCERSKARHAAPQSMSDAFYPSTTYKRSTLQVRAVRFVG
jgi:hypothetical protein